MDHAELETIEIWKLLPFFNAVAATGSISQAAEVTQTSAPTVSKGVKQLEERLGIELFIRTGRGVDLTEAGRSLYANSNRWYQECVQFVRQHQHRESSGVVNLGSTCATAHWLFLETLGETGKRFPDAVFSIRQYREEDPLRHLREAKLDVFVGSNFAAPSDVVSETLCELPVAIYAGRSHPLYGRESATVEEITEFPFAVQTRRPLVKQVWPKEVARRIGLVVDSHALGVEACMRGGYLCVFPDVEVESQREAGDLWRIPCELLGSASLVVCARPEALRRDVVAAFIEGLRSGVAPLARTA